MKQKQIFKMVGIAFAWSLHAMAESSVATQTPPVISVLNYPQRPVIGASHRFVAAGMSVEDNQALVASSEQLASKIEGLIGAPVPFEPGEYILLRVFTDPERDEARVVTSQNWDGMRLLQTINIFNMSRVDSLELAGGYCRVVLGIYAGRRQQDSARRTGGADIPDWLSFGLGRFLDPATRSGDTQVMGRLHGLEYVPPFKMVLSMAKRPPASLAEKAAACMAVAWLQGFTSTEGVWAALLNRCAARQPVSIDWIASLLDFPSPAALEKSWLDWIARRSTVLYPQDAIISDKLGDLAALLTIRPREYGVLPKQNVPVVMTWPDMMVYRDAEWLPQVLTLLRMRVMSLAVGQPPEVQKVVQEYLEYLNLLMVYVETPIRKRPRLKKPDPRWERAWQTAETVRLAIGSMAGNTSVVGLVPPVEDATQSSRTPQSPVPVMNVSSASPPPLTSPAATKLSDGPSIPESSSRPVVTPMPDRIVSNLVLETVREESVFVPGSTNSLSRDISAVVTPVVDLENPPMEKSWNGEPSPSPTFVPLPTSMEANKEGKKIPPQPIFKRSVAKEALRPGRSMETKPMGNAYQPAPESMDFIMDLYVPKKTPRPEHPASPDNPSMGGAPITEQLQ